MEKAAPGTFASLVAKRACIHRYRTGGLPGTSIARTRAFLL
jgi:hypothetical protein